MDRSNVFDARFFHIVAGGERDAQKPFCQRMSKMRRYLSEKCSIRFGANGYGTNGGAKQFHAAERLAGSLRVRKIIRGFCR